MGAYDEGTATRASAPPSGASVDDTGDDRAGASQSGLRGSIGQYDVVAKLGQGGMAEVHLAVARGPIEDFHKLVVLKRLRASLRGEHEYVDMFLREARIAARLSHPNVVHTYSVEVDRDWQCIVMEYLDGVPLSMLAKRMRNRPLSERMVLLAALSDALAGLHYVHAFRDYDGKPLGFVHRDVKPGNIFVTFDGQVKVLDFGVVKQTGADSTASLAIKGTARYMAPEMVGESPKIDARADVFAAGVVLWELASGKKLWEGSNNLQILRRLADNDVPTVESVSEGVPPELNRVCQRALQTEPDLRYQTAREFKEELDTFLREQGVGSFASALARIATDEFGELRESRSRAIRDRLAQVAAAVPVASDAVPVFVSGSNSSAMGPGVTAVAASSAPPRPRRTLWAVLGTALVLGGAGVTYAAIRQDPAEPSAPKAAAFEQEVLQREEAAEPALPPTNVETVPQPSEQPPVAPDEPTAREQVEEQVEFEPEDSRAVEPAGKARKRRARRERGAAAVTPARVEPEPKPKAKVEPGELPGKKSKKKSRLKLDKDAPWMK